jgi:hypothetical protein
MTTVLTGVNGGTFPNTAVGPAAGETITAASVYNGLQGVLNECKYLYDTKGALAVANTWTAKQTFDLASAGTGLETAADTTADFNGPVTLDGAVTQTSTYTKSGDNAVSADRTSAITASAVTATLDTTKDYWYVETPAPAGNTATYTIADSIPVPPTGGRLEFTCFDIGINTIRLEREGGQLIVRFTGAPNWGSATLRYFGGSWRLADVAGAYDTATWNP